MEDAIHKEWFSDLTDEYILASVDTKNSDSKYCHELSVRDNSIHLLFLDSKGNEFDRLEPTGSDFSIARLKTKIARYNNKSPVGLTKEDLHVHFLKHSDYGVRLQGLRYLAQTKNGEYSKYIVSALNDASASVRIEASKLLAYKKNVTGQSFKALHGRLEKEKDLNVRTALSAAILSHNSNDKIAHQIFLDAFKSSIENKSYSSADQITLYLTSFNINIAKDQDIYVNLLIKAVNLKKSTRNNHLKRRSIEALGNLGSHSKSALSILRNVILETEGASKYSQDWHAGRAAKIAINKITKK